MDLTIETPTSPFKRLLYGAKIPQKTENLLSPCEQDIADDLSRSFRIRQRELVQEGINRKLLNGVFPGKAPFGYLNCKVEKKGRGFMLLSGEAVVAEDCLKAALNGATDTFDILCTVIRKHEKLSRISEDKVVGILRNPFYAGYFIYKGVIYEGNPKYHPSIISFGEWLKIQDDVFPDEKLPEIRF